MTDPRPFPPAQTEPDTAPDPVPTRTSPLGPLQLGMIYESLASEHAGVNLEQVVVRLAPHPDWIGMMRSAWSATAASHPALRVAADLTSDHGPVQRVQPKVDFGFQRVDLTDDADIEISLARFLTQDRQQGIDPLGWPNWRVTLVSLAGGQAAMIWSFPHWMLDGRSFSALLAEVFDHYDALVGGQLPPAPNPRPETWSHYRAAAAAQDKAVDHFAHYLGDFEAANRVGLGMPVQKRLASQKRVVERTLCHDQTGALARCADRAGVTLATVLNAAWGVVLARSSGRSTAVFGVTRAGRHLVPESQAMLGCLINTVPLAVRIGPTTTLDDLLRHVRADQLAMRPHEHCPISAIGTALNLPRDRPLFHSLVMYERQTLNDTMRARGGAWAERQVELHEEGALPLTLAAYGESQLLLRLEHEGTQVPDQAAARYMDYLIRLLLAMASARGDAPLSTLDMLSPDETLTLHDWAQGPAQITQPSANIAAALGDLAKAHPKAAAILSADGTVTTHDDLSRQIERLAARLAARGVGPGDIVALCLPRSPEYVAALFAVLKVGAAFLPLDPSYPAESLGFMLRDSGARLLLTQRQAPWMSGHEVLDLGTTDRDCAPCADRCPAGDQPAYVIYTSGTTGRPKGVVVPVSALAAHAAAARDWLGLTPDDRVLQFTSLGFDVSVEEIVPTLLAGATLVLRSELSARDPRALLALVADRGVTVMNLPTGYWQALADDMDLSGMTLPDSVRLVVTGGERVPAATLRRWRKIAPQTAWINGYGPTEATITSAAFALPAGAPAPSGGEVPVGRPLAHARMRILAADRSLAPARCMGELWIGGPCVATGYLHRSDLTAERFVRLGDDRLYASGDLACWTPDGTLMLEGRADRQVKLRGYRIEPAEIERVLEGLDNVGQALVAILAPGTATARLVAWVRASNPAEPLEPDALEAATAGLLPVQMRPRIQVVDDWPMRAGGKIDIQRLPHPEDIGPNTGRTAPADQTTQRISGLFADLLGVPTVGPDAGFFDLGGHSLLLIRLIGRIEAAFGRRLSVAELHAGPTPRAIARLLTEEGTVGRSLNDCIVAIQPTGSLPPIYGVHVLGVNGNYYRPLSAALGPDQPVLGLTVGMLDEFTPTGVAETAELYHRVIDRHQPEGSLSLVAVSLGSYVALELAQRLLAAGRDVKMLAILDAEGPAGRGRISRQARILAHLTRLRRAPFAYVSAQTGHKLNEFRHWWEKLRLVLSGRMGRPRAPATSVEGFVAANELAVQAYRPRPYPRRLTIVRATDSIFDSDEAIATGLGWAPVAEAGFDLVEVPGDHLSIMDPPAVEILAGKLRLALDRADAGR